MDYFLLIFMFLLCQMIELINIINLGDDKERWGRDQDPK